jgi:hypothetical protein
VEERARAPPRPTISLNHSLRIIVHYTYYPYPLLRQASIEEFLQSMVRRTHSTSHYVRRMANYALVLRAGEVDQLVCQASFEWR